MDLVLRLETRTRQLILQHKQLLEEQSKLRNLLAKQEEQILELQIENEELKNKYAHLKMAKYIDLTDDDKRLSRSRINKMVRDVEKCIAMLKVE
ncbi:MAG: hypothetical protein J6L60_10175 [Bacteroidaceae bacterium]|nr:hypothetical protein [Bacteroidaceae bacterium]